ncbi:MAG: class I SAM-dependent methyltransferase [Acidobacteriota bacterium]|nr:class I SAM-dependent methyltransferase [Acidobacteriota bacterium]
MRVFGDWRVERYYRRTLSDSELARQWRDHTFRDLEMPAEPAVLDYGCGRGRHVALLSQLGLRVAAQDIEHHAWWRHLDGCGFQVVPPDAPRLPWIDGTFHAVLDVTVIHHLDRAQLQALAAEVFRVLAPGGYWLLTEANSESYGAAAPMRHYGRLHSLPDVQAHAAAAGFQDAGHSYEGFYAPVLTTFVNFLRKQAWPGPFTVDDFDSPLAAMMPASRRALWRLCLRKPLDNG